MSRSRTLSETDAIFDLTASRPKPRIGRWNGYMVQASATETGRFGAEMSENEGMEVSRHFRPDNSETSDSQAMHALLPAQGDAKGPTDYVQTVLHAL